LLSQGTVSLAQPFPLLINGPVRLLLNCVEDSVNLGFGVSGSAYEKVLIRINADAHIMPESTSSVTCTLTHTPRIKEVARRKVPVPKILGPCHDFGRVGFVVRLPPTNLSKFLSYRQSLFAGNGDRLMRMARDGRRLQ
jgi:hypothetical protein